MPRNLEVFTTCAGPDVARPHQRLGGIAGALANAYMSNPGLTVAGALAVLVSVIAVGTTGAYAAFVATAAVALVEFKHWYYNERLLCIRDDECAIGTVISKPTAAQDGDRKLNLMLAPYDRAYIESELAYHIDRNRGWLSQPDPVLFPSSRYPDGPPEVPDTDLLLNDRRRLLDYLKELKGGNPGGPDTFVPAFNQIVVGLVDRMMTTSQTTPEGNQKNFFERFLRKVESEIPDSATFDYIPVDFDDSVNWRWDAAFSTQQFDNKVLETQQTLNPQCRFGGSSEPLVPYLHCEIEGNAIAILVDDIMTAVVAFGIAGAIGSALGGPFVGGAAGLLGALIAWAIKKLIDWLTGNDGDADEPDIDWDDPDVDSYTDHENTSGDVVVAHGHWIMDTEHNQYFEIHPVRAYYILAQNDIDADTPAMVSTNEDQVGAGVNFDPEKLEPDMAQEICARVREAEQTEPSSSTTVSESAAMSMGLRTHY